MKKILVLAILAVLFAVMGPMASTVYADWVAQASVVPPVIRPGGSVVITISNIGDEAFGVCTLRVTRPDGTRDEVHPANEVINPDESWSCTYPADFGGNTDQTGKYAVRLWVTDALFQFPCVEVLPPPEFEGLAYFVVTSGCFIATAAYGTPMAEEIDILRDFRDQYLLTNPVGETLVELYYKTSPPIADFIDDHPALKPVVRAALVPAIAMSTVAVNTTLVEKIAIVSSVGLVSALLVFWFRRRTGKARGRAN